MNGPETARPTDAPPGGEAGAPTASRWVAGAAGAALVLVPALDLTTITGLGIALLVLLGGAWPRPNPPARGWTTPVVAGAGALLLVGLLAVANPWCGVAEMAWPWTLVLEDRAWPGRWDVVLLFLGGLFALGVGLARPARPAAPAAVVALGLFLAARATSENAAFPLLRIEGTTFLWTSGAAALGTGLLHLASGRPERRGIARSLVLVGAVGMLAVWISRFPSEPGALVSSVTTWVREARRVVDGILRGQEQDPEARRQILERGIAFLLPFALQSAAIVLGVGVAAASSRRSGRPLRAVALVAWLGLFVGWLLPAKVGAFAWLRDHEAAGVDTVARHAADTALRSGLVPWLLVVAGLGALLSRPPGAHPASWPRGAVRAYAPRWGYVAGALLVLAATARAFHPRTGSVLAEGIAGLLSPLRWDAAVATFAFLVATLLAALAAVALPAGAGRGGLVATVALAAWGSLSPPAARDYGLEGWVPQATLAVAAGALWAGATAPESGRAAARWLAGAAGGALLLIVVWPLSVPVPASGGASVFNDALLELTRGWEGETGTPARVAATAPWRLGVVVDATVAVLALLFATRGKALLGRVAVGLFVLDLAYTCLWQGLVDFHDLRTSLYQWGDALLLPGLPMAMLVPNAVRDLHATPTETAVGSGALLGGRPPAAPV